jgi:hypothetical protein
LQRGRIRGGAILVASSLGLVSVGNNCSSRTNADVDQL